MQNTSRSILLITTLTGMLLTGCGFHPRGETLIPRDLGTIYVGGSEYGEITHQIRNELQIADIAIAKMPSDASYKIMLVRSNSNDRVLSLGDGARAAQYMLLEEATIEIRDTQDKVLIGPETLSERRILNYNSDTPQDSSQEQKVLRSEMRKNLARKIARQLRVVADKKPATAS